MSGTVPNIVATLSFAPDFSGAPRRAGLGQTVRGHLAFVNEATREPVAVVDPALRVFPPATTFTPIPPALLFTGGMLLPEGVGCWYADIDANAAGTWVGTASCSAPRAAASAEARFAVAPITGRVPAIPGPPVVTEQLYPLISEGGGILTPQRVGDLPPLPVAEGAVVYAVRGGVSYRASIPDLFGSPRPARALLTGAGVALATSAGVLLYTAGDLPSVTSVAGRGGAVTLVPADITGFGAAAAAAAPVQSVAGRGGAVTIAANDVSGLASLAAAVAPVQSVAGRGGAVTIAAADVSGLAAAAAAAAPVQSVAGRGGAVTIAAVDVSGLAAAAAAAAPVQSVAGRGGAVTIAAADVSGLAAAVAAIAPVQSVAGRSGAVTIAATDVSGLAAAAAAAAPVQSVAGRGGAVALGSADIIDISTAITRQAQITAPAKHIMAHRPFANSLAEQSKAVLDMSRGSGNTAYSAWQLPSHAIAVRLVAGGQTANAAFAWQGAMVAASTAYGPGSTTGGGQAPYDQTGTLNQGMWRAASFNSTGAAQEPWENLPETIAASNFGSISGSLITSAGTASGSAVLTFASTLMAAVHGGKAPLTGLYANSYSGNIPAGTTVASTTSTTITLSANVTGAIASGEIIFFTAEPITLSVNFTMTELGPENFIRSDWIPCGTLPRYEACPAVGMAASGAGIPGGATVTAFDNLTVTLSAAATATTTGQQAITLTTTHTLAAAVTIDQVEIPCADTSRIAAGQIVTGTGVGTGNSVAFVGQGYYRLAKLLTAAIAAGTVLTFQNVLYTYGSGGIVAGATTHTVNSTNQLPLVLVRSAFDPGPTNLVGCAIGASAGAMRVEALNPGIPMVTCGRKGTAGDALLLPATAANGNFGANGLTPILWLEYLSVVPGHTVGVTGDSQSAGISSGSTSTLNAAKLAVAELSSLDAPVSLWNGGFGGSNFNQFGIMARRFIDAAPISIMIYQQMSRNSNRDTVDGYMARMLAEAEHCRRKNVLPVLMSNAPWGVRQSMAFVVAASVVNATSVTTRNVVPFNLTAAPVTGAVTGVTATMSSYGYVVTFSAPVTLNAGDVFYTNTAIIASNVTASTAITLTSGFPVYASGLTYMSWNGGANVATVSASENTTNVTATTPVTIAAGTVVYFYNANTLPQERADGRAWFRRLQNSLRVPTIDLYGDLEDPLDPGWYKPTRSTDGVHYNDIGAQEAKPRFKAVLRALIGL